jgi:hypothetical protein
MNKYLILLLTVLIPNLSLGKEVKIPQKKNPVLTEILKLNPKADRAFATELAGYILKYSKQFKTDPRVSVAIAMQETAFVNKNREGSVYTKDRQIVHGVTDVGVFQIHIATIAYLGIDIERLKTDVDYQTYWHTKILADKIKVCKSKRQKFEAKSGDEWSCYHSFTLDKRLEYVSDVGAHLAKLGQ